VPSKPQYGTTAPVSQARSIEHHFFSNLRRDLAINPTIDNPEVWHEHARHSR
jgi:hypothetical protein